MSNFGQLRNWKIIDSRRTNDSVGERIGVIGLIGVIGPIDQINRLASAKFGDYLDG